MISLRQFAPLALNATKHLVSQTPQFSRSVNSPLGTSLFLTRNIRGAHPHKRLVQYTPQISNLNHAIKMPQRSVVFVRSPLSSQWGEPKESYFIRGNNSLTPRYLHTQKVEEKTASHTNNKLFKLDHADIVQKLESEFHSLNKQKELTCASAAKRIEEQYKDQNLTAGSAVLYNGAFGMKSKLPGMKDSPRHAAIYLGHGLIAHFTGGAEPGQLQGKVQIDLFSTFEENAKKQGGTVIVENLETTKSSDEIIKAAFDELGNTNYDALNNNCQHFVYRVITGKSKSPQVDELTKMVKKEIKKPVATVTKKLTDRLVEKLPETTVGKIIKPVLKGQVGKALSSGIGSATGQLVELGARKISSVVSRQLANPNSWVSKTAGFFATALA